MLAFMVEASIYSVIIIFSFNLLPYNWLCDYDTDTSDCSKQKFVSLTLCFLPMFLFTIISIFLIFISTYTVLQRLTYIAMILLLAHIFFSDILYMIIPDQHIILILFLGILNINSNNLYDKILGLFAGALPFLILLILGISLKKREYIGFGDIKLMSVLGFLLGYIDIFKIYLLSCLLSGLYFIILTFYAFLLKKDNISSCLPFAPFIIFSFIFCLIL